MSFRSQRTFWIFVAASLAVHTLVLSGLPGIVAFPEHPSTVLSAELETVKPPPVAEVKPEPPKPAPVARKRAASPARVASSAPPAAPAPPVPSSAPPMPPVVEMPSEETQAPPAEGAAMTESAAAATETPSEPESTPEPPAPVAGESDAPADAKFPPAGKITYEVFFGTDKFSIGRSVQTWSIDKTTYRLTSFSETTGLVGLFRPYQYAYVSEGRVDATGLRPEMFSVRRGREGERQAIARFDWDNGELTFGPLSAPNKVPLEAGTYDFLSFIYQLARTRLAPGLMRLVITTGTKVNTYVLDVGAVESIELPLGTIRAIPIRQIHNPGEDSVQLWMAADQPQLPVRIRFLDREGRMTVEQLANKIDFEGA